MVDYFVKASLRELFDGNEDSSSSTLCEQEQTQDSTLSQKQVEDVSVYGIVV